MDSFFDRLKVWLGANETDRRKAFLATAAIVAFSGFASWRTALIVTGLLLIVEGWATLVATNNVNNAKSMKK